MKSRGFTIVELVIVIAIVGILGSISLVASSQVQKDSRDKKRDADITLLQNELEKFYDRNGEYPPGCSNNCTSWFFTENISTGGTILMDTSTNATIKSVLPGITTSFYDPKNTTPDTPLAASSSSSDRYFYFGGTVNNRTASSGTSNQTPSPNVCILSSSLNPGEVGSYIVGYYSEIENRWVLKAGQNGKPMTLGSTSHTSCKIE